MYGWYSAMISPHKVKAIVSFEPGHFIFPEGEKLSETDYGMMQLQKHSNLYLFAKKNLKNLLKCQF